MEVTFIVCAGYYDGYFDVVITLSLYYELNDFPFYLRLSEKTKSA